MNYKSFEIGDTLRMMDSHLKNYYTYKVLNITDDGISVLTPTDKIVHVIYHSINYNRFEVDTSYMRKKKIRKLLNKLCSK